jgi:hypothetical protein
VITGEQRYHLLPGSRTARDAVNEKDGGTLPDPAEAEIVTVDPDVFELWLRS